MTECQLPRGWISATIGDLIAPGGLFRDGDWVETEDQDPNGDVRLIQLADIGDGVYRNKSRRLMTRESAEKLDCTLLHEGDVLIARMPDPLGRACIFPGDEKPSVTAVDVCIVRTGTTEIGHRWLQWFVNAPRFRVAIASLQSGSTRKRISRGNLATLKLPLPPSAEQQRIVAKIEELFSDLDAGVAALERVKAKLKRYRAAVLKAAVEGRLTAEWRRTHPATEPADKLLERILAERRRKWEEAQLRKYAESGKPPPKGWREKYSAPHRLAESDDLPKGWCRATVDQLAAVGTGTTPSRDVARYYGSGTIPWVTSTAVNAPFISEGTEQVTDAALRETSLRIYPASTLVIALYGEGQTRGKVSELLIPATINQALAALTLDGIAAGCRPFLKTFLFSNYVRLRSQSAGGVQPNLNLGLVREIAVPLPPLTEQGEIVAEVDRRLSVVEAVEAEVEHGLKRAARLRQAILKRAFEGKLVPQDPTDEPASKLLERIRAERADSTSRPAKINRASRSRPTERKITI